MALKAFRIVRRSVSNGWEYAPRPGSHKDGHFPDGSPFNFEWLYRQLKRDKRITDVGLHLAMRSAGCQDARACNPRLYAGDVILVDDADPLLHPVAEDAGGIMRQNDRIKTMIELKESWIPDASINVNSIAGTARMQRILQGPPKDGEYLPTH